MLLSGGDQAGLNNASPYVDDKRGAFADGVDECQLTTASDRRACSQVFRPMIDTEWRTAFNNGVNESSGLMSVTSGRAVKRESVKQLGATPLNSISQGHTWQRPSSDTRHVKPTTLKGEPSQIKTSQVKEFSSEFISNLFPNRGSTTGSNKRTETEQQ